jgi:uncharacterized protein (TIGR03435 family)
MRWAIAFILMSSAMAQDAKLPSFEVASIKPSGPQSKIIGMYTYRGGRVTVENYTLAQLLEEALHVQRFQITGGPEWVRTDRFDMDARVPLDSKSSKADPDGIKMPPNDEQRAMILSLLIERFQLKFHRESKDGAVYFLVKTNKPWKPAPTSDAHEFPWVGGPEGAGIGVTGVAAKNATMALVAERLAPYVQRPVIDRTGVVGAFDFKYVYSPVDGQGDRMAAILESLQAQGLKLEAGRAPIEMIVIESAQRLTAN